MFESSDPLRCFGAYLRSVTTPTASCAPSTNTPSLQAHSRKVLIVEFRDEVYVELRSLFENNRYEVVRAESGAAVAHRVRKYKPDIVVLNGAMPDESGWLISCKLRLTNVNQPIWLYTSQEPELLIDWKQFCEVNEIIPYGGVVARLRSRIAKVLQRWQGDPTHIPLFQRCSEPISSRKCA